MAGGKLPPKRNGHIHTFGDNYVEYPHVGENLILDHKGASTSRYLFRFFSPSCDEIFKDTDRFDNRANRSFFARLYWNGRPTSKVVILFNGLDETIHRFRTPNEPFRFYDGLGEHLANKDCLTILLPTPYHLNRVLTYHDEETERCISEREGSRYIDLTIPTKALIRNNINVYRNHFQGFKETVALCRALRPDLGETAFPEIPLANCVDDHARAIFVKALEQPVRISLVGYSLGGLRAITEYLRDRYEARGPQRREALFSTCTCHRYA